MTELNGPAKKCSRIVRTERGLSIDGTRKTLYQVMDYVVENRPPKEIQEHLLLTDEQLAASLEYIAAHREEVQAEYEQVVRDADAERAYWEERNKDVIARIRSVPHVPGKEALREKLLAWKAQRRAES